MIVEKLSSVLRNFATVKSQPFAKNDFSNFLKKELPNSLRTNLPEYDRYLFKGSAGMTQWTHCPWLAIMDPIVTQSAETGYYVVCSFRADLTGFFLSLNQGVTDIREQYRANASQVLLVRASDFLAKLGKPPKGFSIGKISLGAPSGSNPSFYDYGNVWGKYYSKAALPTDDELITDLKILMKAYERLVEVDSTYVSFDADDNLKSIVSESENVFLEGRRIKFHARLERSKALSKRAKEIHGYRCQVCNFDFEKSYGEIGKKFIEAHHLTPLAQLTAPLKLDAKRDFAVLCSNCHRMVHRLDDPNAIENLKRLIKKF